MAPAARRPWGSANPALVPARGGAPPARPLPDAGLGGAHRMGSGASGRLRPSFEPLGGGGTQSAPRQPGGDLHRGRGRHAATASTERALCRAAATLQGTAPMRAQVAPVCGLSVLPVRAHAGGNVLGQGVQTDLCTDSSLCVQRVQLYTCMHTHLCECTGSINIRMYDSIVEYPELEVTHRDHQLQFLALAQENPNNPVCV